MATNRTLARLERVLTMVPWLLDHPGVEVDEVCWRFAVSRSELTRDLEILSYCGLPGYGGGDLVEAWVVGDSVWVHMADFFARPLRLNLRQGLTLLLAGQALASLPELPESPQLDSAVAKVAAALEGEARVAVDLRAPGEELLPRLRAAITDRRVVHLVYRSRSKAETTERDVEPWAIVGAGGAWYLSAYCRRAQGARHFRLDRVRDLTVTDEPFADEPRTPASTAPRAIATAPVYRHREGDVEVELELAPGGWWVIAQLVVDEVVAAGELRRVILHTGEQEWLARLVLRLGADARVVRPPALAERVTALASATLRRYHSSSRP